MNPLNTRRRIFSFLFILLVGFLLGISIPKTTHVNLTQETSIVASTTAPSGSPANSLSGISIFVSGIGDKTAAAFITKDLVEIVSEGGLPVETSIHSSVSVVDLNTDGIPEYIVNNIFIGSDFSGGATGNEAIYVYGKIDQNWKRIGTIAGSFSIEKVVKNKTSAEFPAITSVWSLGGNEIVNYHYQWDKDKKEYILASQEKTYTSTKG